MRVVPIAPCESETYEMGDAVRLSEMDAAVEERNRLRQPRDWMQHQGAACSIEVRTRDTKDTWRFPRDIRITLCVAERREWWTWADLVREAGRLAAHRGGRSVLYQSCVRLWNDDDLEDVLAATDMTPEACEWERLLRMLQGMALCEERRYGDHGVRIRRFGDQLVHEPMRSNGWWTPFHLMRCVSLGSAPAHMASVAARMKGGEDPATGELMKARPILAEDCNGCRSVEGGVHPVCISGSRPWVMSGRRVLRDFYGDAGNNVHDRFTLEASEMRV